MQKSHKELREAAYGIENLKGRYMYLEKVLTETSGKDAFSKTLKYFNDAIAKLTKEQYALPTGHRYTGTFYLKKPYSYVVEFLKVEGSIFMREDLSSWFIETDDKDVNRSYRRVVYKEPRLDADTFTREDGEVVYLKEPTKSAA